MEKKALLVISFGTSHQNKRERTIRACETHLEQSFLDYDFFMAYTSDKIIKKIAQKENRHVDGPDEALNRIYQLGYEEVFVVSLHLLKGHEYQKVADAVLNYQSKFKQIKLSLPLLATNRWNEEVKDIIYEEVALETENEALLLVGHGSDDVMDDPTHQIATRLASDGLDVYSTTLRHHQNLDEVIQDLKIKNVTCVHLFPLMLVCGHHAVKDLSGQGRDVWAQRLKAEGFDVKVYLKGLGANEKIQALFVKQAKLCQMNEEGIDS